MVSATDPDDRILGFLDRNAHAFIIIIIKLSCKGFTWWQWYYSKTQHTDTYITFSWDSLITH
jgi:hypothetical protein